MSYPRRICGRQSNILCPLYWNYFLLGFLFWNNVRFQAVPLKIALMNDSLGFSRGVPLKRNIVNNGFVIKISSGKWPLTPLTPCIGQRRKTLGSRVALLPGEFLRVRKVFARITEKPFKLPQYFQNSSHFSRWLPIFLMISKLSWFSRWLPISRIISKLKLTGGQGGRHTGSREEKG